MDNTVSEVRAFLRGETSNVSAFIEMPDGNWKSWDEVAREIVPTLEGVDLDRLELI